MEHGAQRPGVLFGAVDIQAHVNSIGRQRLPDGSQQSERINGVMHHIESGDHIVLLRDALGCVQLVERYPIGNSRCLSAAGCQLDGRRKYVVTDEPLRRKSLSELDERPAAATANVCDLSSFFQLGLHIRHPRIHCCSSRFSNQPAVNRSRPSQNEGWYAD